jgi:hypothetical protein
MAPIGATPVGDVDRHETGEGMSAPVANEAYNRLSHMAWLEVLDRDLTTPPGSPSEGDCYIVGASATGDWSGEDGNVAIYYSGWLFITPAGGAVAFIKDEKQWYCYSSQESEWHAMQELWIATEHWTGRYSAESGGEKIYAKVINTGTLTDRSSSTAAHSISNLDIDNHIKLCGYCDNGTNSFHIPNECVRTYIDTTNVNFVTGIDMSAYSGKIRIEYCKTA